jgi:cellulose synthase/poly-beta-1,6-N-acetylglucosamine synthase-like glycosyltransferase
MGIVLIVIWLPVLTYLTFAVLYHAFLAVAYFVVKEKRLNRLPGLYRYMLLIPAHNEQAVIGRMLESVKKANYDSNLFKVMVIADNCTDNTAEIAAEHKIEALIREEPARRGKGFAIEWALRKIDLDDFDAVVIADADNLIDPAFFHGLNEVIAAGGEAIQCNNCLANPEETSFTKIIHLSRTINNELYHHAKHKLGLSAYLMGNGMCFTTRILKKYGWGAGTIAEDYEYYAKLVEHNILIGFAANARLFHQESRGVRHATNQRLRWSSGRFQVARLFGIGLLKKGLREKNFRIVDASFALILPNLSLMVNMTFVTMLLLVLLYPVYPMPFLVYLSTLLLFLEFAYFLAGVYLTKMSIWKFACALAYSPVFLLWKGGIDIIGILGRKIGQWGRAERL